ncbi:putative serine/threonine-protein kinase with WD40 domains [Parafrankia sp. EAN1pec]|nr:putative serine/threonine-protein kinase with WD40 domains [Frankia sp. EAN1pec]
MRRPAAIKVMPAQTAEGERIDYIEADDLCLVVMELLAGGTLTRQRAGMRPEQACAVGLAVSAALSHAHARNVLHRDVKRHAGLHGARADRGRPAGPGYRSLRAGHRALPAPDRPAAVRPEAAAAHSVAPAADRARPAHGRGGRPGRRGGAACVGEEPGRPSVGRHRLRVGARACHRRGLRRRLDRPGRPAVTSRDDVVRRIAEGLPAAEPPVGRTPDAPESTTVRMEASTVRTRPATGPGGPRTVLDDGGAQRRPESRRPGGPESAAEVFARLRRTHGPEHPDALAVEEALQWWTHQDSAGA